MTVFISSDLLSYGQLGTPQDHSATPEKSGKSPGETLGCRADAHEAQKNKGDGAGVSSGTSKKLTLNSRNALTVATLPAPLRPRSIAKHSSYGTNVRTLKVEVFSVLELPEATAKPM